MVQSSIMQSIRTLLTKSEAYLLPLIVLLTMGVFVRVIWHDFIDFDDPSFVTLNANIQAGLSIESLRWALGSGYMANWMPLTWMSHMLDIQLFGLNPAGHHFVNILFHTASSGLLFLFLRRATGDPWQSAAVALLFALHPLRVESVAWVAERKDVLSAFFGMLTLHAYGRYVEKPGPGRYLCALVLFALGLMAKSMLVTLPVVLLLMDWWPHRRFLPQQGNTFRLLGEKIPFLMLSACSGMITYLVHKSFNEVFEGFTLWAKIARAVVSYVVYLQKMIWPTKLAIIYPFSLYPPAPLQIVLCSGILLLITGGVIWLRKESPYLLTGWFWFLITLLPVIGLIHIGQHSIADRYTYIPLIGIFLMLAWGVPQLCKKWRLPASVNGVLAIAALVAMIVVTSLQLRHWKNSYTIFSHAVAVTDGNWVAHNNLGLYVMNEGKVDLAISHFRQSLQAKPSYAVAHVNLGVALYKRGEVSSALNSIKMALTIDPGNESARLGLGLLYADQGDMERALIEYRKLEASGSPLAGTLLQSLRKN